MGAGTGAMPDADWHRMVRRYALAGLANISREYPNHPGHLLTGPEDLAPPSTLHPIFFGSFDWHSSVHQHWMLVRLLRLHPDLEAATAIRSELDRRFGPEAGRTEAAYFEHPARRSFERPYGWAWLCTLVGELRTWDDADARRWADALRPLADAIRRHCLGWLKAAGYPNRSGTHGNSAFACTLLLDVARATGDAALAGAVERAARRWYAEDSGYPAWIEPSGVDFLSPALTEAVLMARLLDRDAFVRWLRRFLADPGPLAQPAEVADRSDPQWVHLDGLNLSRAWCWLELARALPADHAWRALARDAASRHVAAASPGILTGEYVADHWIPTFAVYLRAGALTQAFQ